MSIFESVRSWNRTRQTRNSLNGLSNHQLEDIGITRDAIPHVARKLGAL